MRNGLFIPPIPGSFGWIFWNYPSSLSWTLNSKFECPGRRYISPEFNPYILYPESWLSNNILNHVVCSIGKCSMCWQILLLFITHSSYDGFFLFLQSWTCCEQILLYPPSHHHCCGDLPHDGGVCPEIDNQGPPLLPFSGWRSSSPSEEPRYTWLWKVISLQHYIPSKRVEIRRVN